MKKVLSALTAIAFTGAYAASLTVGGQVNAGIKVKGGNHGEDTKVQYYLDEGDTKIFLNYKDEAKGIAGVIIGAFDNGALNAKEAWIKFDLFRSGDVSTYMILGLQPNVIKVCDISITNVYGTDGTSAAKVEKAVTLGVSFGGTKLQSTLVDPKVNPNDKKGFYSLAEVAAILPTKYADVAVALDMDPGKLGNSTDNKWLLYGYINIKAIDPVNIEAQVSYGKQTEVENSTISGVAVKVASNKEFKLISKPAKPYIQIEYINANKANGQNDLLLRGGDVPSGVDNTTDYYLDSQFAIKVGTVVKYNKHLTENGYIKYIAAKYAPENKTKSSFEKTSLEVGADFTLKFAKSINLD